MSDFLSSISSSFLRVGLKVLRLFVLLSTSGILFHNEGKMKKIKFHLVLDLKKEFATAVFKKIPLLTVIAKDSFR